MYVCMYLCMSVRNGFTIEIYGFMHSLCTFGMCCSGCHCAMVAWRSMSRTRKIEDDDRTSPDVWKTVNCSTKKYIKVLPHIYHCLQGKGAQSSDTEIEKKEGYPMMRIKPKLLDH